MMPFWAAALLFYLRARRSLSAWTPCSRERAPSLVLLGKYWGVYLFAGMAVASFVGAGDATILAVTGSVRDGGGRGDRARSSRLLVRGACRRDELRVHPR